MSIVKRQIFLTIFVFVSFFSVSNGCTKIGTFWTDLLKNGAQMAKSAGAATKTFVCHLSQFDEIIVNTFTNSLTQRFLISGQPMIGYVGGLEQNDDPTMANILQKLFFIYQKIKLMNFIWTPTYKIILTSTLAYSVIFLAKRSGIPFKTILNVMMKVRDSRMVLGNLSKLLLRKSSTNWQTNEKEEKSDEQQQNDDHHQKWMPFHQQFVDHANGLVDNILAASNDKKEKFRRRRKKRRYELGTAMSMLIMLGLMLLLRWLILFVVNRNTHLMNIGNMGQQRPLGLPAKIGEAHMATFNQMKDIEVGGERSSADVEQQQTETCAICLLEIEPGTVIKQLPACRHSFHIECLRIWLKGYNNFCPICRTKIFTEYANGKVELNTRQHNYGAFDDDTILF